MSILDKLTQNLGGHFQDVKSVFDSSNIPEWVWAPIMSMESGGNPNARALTSQEDSRGLFQINVKAHPQWRDVNLFDPVTNAKIASTNFIAPAYNKAIQSGLTNKNDITAYVWKNGIRPAWNSQKETAIKSATNSIVQDNAVQGGLGGAWSTIKDNPDLKSGAIWGGGGLAVGAGASSFWDWFKQVWSSFTTNIIPICLAIIGIILVIAVLKSMFLSEGGTSA